GGSSASASVRRRSPRRSRSPPTVAGPRSRSGWAWRDIRSARGGGPSAPISTESDSSLTRVRLGSDSSRTLGEMHVRRNCYIGVAPVGQNLTNVCLVRPSQPADADLRDPAALLTRELARDPWLGDRFADARMIAKPVVLGPLAVDAVPGSFDGLILAGDAAGFVDPMTGDGLRFAIRGAELAAAAALDALAHGWTGVHARLAAARRGEFSRKQQFNRALRRLVASPRAIDLAALGSRVAPFVMRRVIARAGDCW